MLETKANASDRNNRKAVFGYIALLAVGILAINASAQLYGGNISDLYGAAVSSGQ